ncbi:arsenate reductase ArsC [Nonomuraea gerenzanensis]|uniref:Arsenate reductase n=1 Tax=Nonomuraea gerenzanensis TaxID=93944 RepID=A0A1M4ED47_9ACTN|nr:arsenate reductase ArsC [Nonomuraea gerenzanensis]SBO96911.1 Arsenate reductase [Nonomuraea gerenzanensis]
MTLEAAARTLADEFDGVFGAETVGRVLRTSHDQLTGRGASAGELPSIAERFARQRLLALARVEGKDTTGVPIVLFLCVHNAGRSQMALGFLTHLAQGRAIGWSGGSAPGERINPSAVEAMRERGIDLAGEYPKPWTPEIAEAADVIVTMGCGDACPVFPGRRYEDWELPDPAGQSVEAVRPIRDEIERRVRALLAQLGVPAAGSTAAGSTADASTAAGSTADGSTADASTAAGSTA